MATASQQLETLDRLVADRVRGVVSRHLPGLYLYGRPGTSKSYSVKSTLERLGAPWEEVIGTLTPIALFDKLDEHCDRFLVLDDVSSIFNQPQALQFLLAATGPANRRGERIIHHHTARAKRTVRFSGGILAMSNLSLQNSGSEVRAALASRMVVQEYEPTDEMIVCRINQIAAAGIKNVDPSDAMTVAGFMLRACEQLNLRPDIRMFVDKSIPDFVMCKLGLVETDWRDLIIASLRQQAMSEHQHPIAADLTRAEQMAYERRIAKQIYQTYSERSDRTREWMEQTGKSEDGFYRRLKELRRAGLLEEPGPALRVSL